MTFWESLGRAPWKKYKNLEKPKKKNQKNTIFQRSWKAEKCKTKKTSRKPKKTKRQYFETLVWPPPSPRLLEYCFFFWFSRGFFGFALFCFPIPLENCFFCFFSFLEVFLLKISGKLSGTWQTIPLWKAVVHIVCYMLSHSTALAIHFLCLCSFRSIIIPPGCPSWFRPSYGERGRELRGKLSSWARRAWRCLIIRRGMRSSPRSEAVRPTSETSEIWQTVWWPLLHWPSCTWSGPYGRKTGAVRRHHSEFRGIRHLPDWHWVLGHNLVPSVCPGQVPRFAWTILSENRAQGAL